MSDGSVTIDTRLNNSEFEKGISKLERIGKKGLQALSVAAGTTLAGFATLGTYAIKVGSDFEAGMSKVQAISGATGKDLERLTEKAKEMGAKTKFSASESAEAFQYMAMAGWKTEDMLNGIEGIMNLAAASGENLASVSDIVTDALTAFGLQAKDSAHFADVLAKASSNSNTNVGMMGETFKYVAPLAGAMKYSIEDTAVAIGLMANAGIKSTQAGTALRSMLTRLVKPPKQAAAALDTLKISATNSNGTMKPLSQTIQELRKKFSKLSESEKANYAAAIAGQEAMSGLLAIVNASEDDFKKLTNAINNSEGATKEMADTMNNNLKGAVTILKSNMESLGVTIYDKFKGQATKGVNSVTKALSDLTKSATNGKLSKSVDKIANSFGKFIEKGADLTVKVLPKLIDGLAWILDHGNIIATAIGAITTAMIAFKATAVITNVIKAWQIATLQLNLFEIATMKVGITQGLTNANLTIGQTVVALLTGKITLATVAQKLWNAAMAANPIGLVVSLIVGLIAGIVLLTKKQEKVNEEMKDFANSMDDARKKTEDYNKSIDQTTITNLAQIKSVTKLKDELKALVDENGKVKEGYKGRAAFILNQLNEALGTEYKLNGDIIESYKTLQGEIDKTLQKKKAEIILQGEEEKWKKAREEEAEATENLRKSMVNLQRTQEQYGMTLDELRDKTRNSHGAEKENLENVLKAYDDAVARKKNILDTEKQYETDYALFMEGKYDEMGKSIVNSVTEWTDGSWTTLQRQIAKETSAIKDWKNTYKIFGDEMTKTQKEQSEERLRDLAKNLADRTSTVNKLGKDECFAWKSLAEGNYRIYSEQLAKMNPEMRKTIEELTGYLQGDTSLPASMEMEVKKTISKFGEGTKQFLTITDDRLSEVAKKIDKDTSVQNSSIGLMQRAGQSISRDTSVSNATRETVNTAGRIIQEQNSTQWGIDLITNFGLGIKRKSSSSWFTSVLKGVGQTVSAYLHHTTPEKGPLKDDDKWMPDMMKNFVSGIQKNTPDIYKASKILSQKVQQGLNIDNIYENMRATVDFETEKLSTNLTTKTTLQLAKDEPKTITNDRGININNTQNFYSKESTPYEEQKQAKQQLRRLAYGL